MPSSRARKARTDAKVTREPPFSPHVHASPAGQSNSLPHRPRPAPPLKWKWGSACASMHASASEIALCSSSGLEKSLADALPQRQLAKGNRKFMFLWPQKSSCHGLSPPMMKSM